MIGNIPRDDDKMASLNNLTHIRRELSVECPVPVHTLAGYVAPQNMRAARHFLDALGLV